MQHTIVGRFKFNATNSEDLAQFSRINCVSKMHDDISCDAHVCINKQFKKKVVGIFISTIYGKPHDSLT